MNRIIKSDKYMNLFTPKNIISPNMDEKYFCPKHFATTVGAATKIPH